MKNNIKKLRKEHNLTLQQMADDLGVSNNSISQYENEKRNPSIDMIVKMSNYFNVSINYLLNIDKTSKIGEKNYQLDKDDDYIKLLADIENSYTQSYDLLEKISFDNIFKLYNWVIKHKKLFDEYNGIYGENNDNAVLYLGNAANDVIEYVKRFTPQDIEMSQNEYEFNKNTSYDFKIEEEFSKQSERIGRKQTNMIINLMKSMKNKEDITND